VISRLTFALVAALAVAGAALAATHPHDPQERLVTADMAKARAAVLKRSDLAGKWASEKPAKEGDERCTGLDPDLSDLTVTGKAKSATFSRADGVVVSSESDVYETAEQARASFDRSIKPSLVRCLDESFRKGLGDAKLRVKLLTGSKAAAPRYGERSARYRAVWRLSGAGGTLKAYMDAYFVVRDRVTMTFFFFSLPQEITPSAERPLVAAVVGRV
jgi:hypothetical protein